MKKIFYIAIGLVGFVTSCDYVENPVVATAGPSTDCDTVFNFTNAPNTDRNVLLEDYTGHNCPACPGHASIAESKKTTWGDRLIIVAIHPDAGGLTDPQTGSSLTTDWRIEEGKKYAVAVNNNSPLSSLPALGFNRTANGANLHYGTSWITPFDNYMPTVGSSNVGVQIDAEKLPDNTICGKVETELLANLTDDYKIKFWLVQDSIQDWQNSDPNYWHRHVLRDVYGHVGEEEGDASGNGNIWGNSLNQGVTGDKEQFIVSFEPKAEWGTDKFYIVAIVYDDATKEIMQVEQYALDH